MDVTKIKVNFTPEHDRAIGNRLYPIPAQFNPNGYEFWGCVYDPNSRSAAEVRGDKF